MAYAVSGGACMYSRAATLMGLALKPENATSGQRLCGESAGSGFEGGTECFWQKCLRSKKRLKMTRICLRINQFCYFSFFVDLNFHLIPFAF